LAGFLFRLETEDGVPAEPWQLTSVVPYWGAGDTIHLGKRTLRVIGKRESECDHLGHAPGHGFAAVGVASRTPS